MKRLLVIIFLIFLGCGGGDNKSSKDDSQTSKQPSNQTSEKKTIRGVAVDGYIKNAKVCIDVNLNNECDENEPSTNTDSEGKFSLNVDDSGEKTILIVGGINLSTNKQFEGVLKEIVDLNDKNIDVNVTPLTTLATQYYLANKDKFKEYKNVKEELSDKLGVKIDIDPMKDKETFKVTQKIYQSAKVISTENNEKFIEGISKIAQSIATKKENETFINNLTVDDDVKLKLNNVIEYVESNNSNDYSNFEKDIFEYVNKQVITKKDDNNNNITSLKEGVLKFSIANTNSENSFFTRAYSFKASGDLIATSDKLANAIDKAKKIHQENIKKMNNSYEIKMPQTANGAVAIFSYDKKYGLVLSEEKIKGGETTDLGEITLLPTKTLSLKIKSSNDENVGLKMNLIGINRFVTTNQNIKITNIPQGEHLITITKNNKPILSKYIEVNSDKNITIDIDNYQNKTLKGVIVDNNGNTLTDVMLFLKPTNDNYSISLTNQNGEFEFENLMEGNFSLIIQKTGFKAIKKENIVIKTNTNLRKIKLSQDVTTGSISGYAYYNDSKEHTGIDITIQKVGGGFNTNQYGTLKDGAFLITDLPQGKYILHFGKSSDSLYSSVDKEVEVVAGATAILEKPIFLKRKTAHIKGKIKFPSNFTNRDLANISIKLVNQNGGDDIIYNLTSINNSDFDIKVPSNESYIMYITGKDSQGNDINTIQKTIPFLNTDDIYEIDNEIVISYIDPNPPVITTLNVTKVLGKLIKTDESYLVNPNNQIKINVTAQDEDGDEIRYYFSSNAGEFVNVDNITGSATYQAPNESGDYTITIKAKSNQREVSKTIVLKVNNYPLIQLNSPTDISDKNSPKEYESNEIVTINTDISDTEDDDNLTIEWFSSLQGKIENNTTILNKQLIPGEHIISVYAKDSLGLVSSKKFYVKINPQSTIWLRTSNSRIQRYITPEGIALNNTYQISIASDYDLNYKSNDESVVSVDENGLIRAENAGSAIVNVYSTQVDTDGNPLYSFNMYVRVVDDIKNKNTPYHIKPGEILQLRVNKDNKPTIIFDVDDPGNYEFLTFDNHDVKNGSYSCVTYYINDNESVEKCGVGKAIFNIDVVDVDDEYKVVLEPKYNDYDEYLKVALIPTANVLDEDNNNLASFFFDSDDEFNDISQLAKEVHLYTATISDVNVLDYDLYDNYYINIKKKGWYSVLFATLSGTSTNGSKYIQITNPYGKVILDTYLYGYGKSELWNWYSFEAKEIGKYKISIFNKNYYTIYYQFNIYPSIANGLIQDEDNEINDFGFMATPITFEEAQVGIEGDIGVRKFDEDDWYEVELKKGFYTLTFNTLIGSTTNTYHKIKIVNKDYSDVLSKKYLNSYSKEELSGSWDFEIKTDGKYKIKVYNNSKSKKTYYKFKITPKD